MMRKMTRMVMKITKAVRMYETDGGDCLSGDGCGI